MRLALGFAAVCIMALTARLATAEIIDRIAVSVDKRVITESEVLRQIRITAFLNGGKPDFSAAEKRATADRLVEQMLIRRELEMTRYAPGSSDPTDIHEQIKERFPNEDAYRQALAEYEITAADVQEALEWQATLMQFIDLRFRPGVQIPEADVRDYYEQQAALNPGKLPPFDEARRDIEGILTARLVDNALDRWLGQARTQTSIRYVQEVFQ